MDKLPTYERKKNEDRGTRSGDNTYESKKNEERGHAQEWGVNGQLATDDSPRTTDHGQVSNFAGYGKRLT
jgi:hypothetical protein